MSWRKLSLILATWLIIPPLSVLWGYWFISATLLRPMETSWQDWHFMGKPPGRAVSFLDFDDYSATVRTDEGETYSYRDQEWVKGESRSFSLPKISSCRGLVPPIEVVDSAAYCSVYNVYYVITPGGRIYTLSGFVGDMNLGAIYDLYVLAFALGGGFIVGLVLSAIITRLVNRR